MPKSKKKKAHARRPAAPNAKAKRRISIKRSTSKKAARIPAKTREHSAKRSPNPAKSGRGRNNSRGTLELLGRNHRERSLDPFTRRQKDRLLQLRDAMAYSMAGAAP